MNVSVVIPSWNGWNLLRQHLPAVIDACRRYPSAEVIVCDDGSSDGTVEKLARHFPQVRGVARRRNGGFGAAANDGVRAARGRFVVCLNNDVRPDGDFLDPLVAALETTPSLFAAAPCTVNSRFGGDEARTVAVFRRGVLDVLFPDRAGPVEERGTAGIFYAPAGAAAYRRERFLRLGGFAPLFHPFYWEDADLGWRAWRRGWGSLHVPSSVVHHQGGKTISERFSGREVQITYERNHLLFLWSNLLDAALWSQHLAWLAPRTVWSATRGKPLARAIFLAGRRAPQALERRRRERVAACVSDREILRRCCRPPSVTARG